MNVPLLAAAETISLADGTMNLFASTTTRIILAVAIIGTALFLLLPGRFRQRKFFGSGLGIVGIGMIWSLVPQASSMSFQAAFWFMASIAVVASTATITSRSPVYSAIWFAVSLMGIAGLFLLQGAQFLGVATVAVYAGAIVVTFLFVLMLAQPEGLTFYDRIPWGTTPQFIIPAMAAALMALLAHSITNANADQVALQNIVTTHFDSFTGEESSANVRRVVVRKYENNIAEIHVEVSGIDSSAVSDPDKIDSLKQAIGEQLPVLSDSVIRIDVTQDLHHAQHVAHLGGNLFGRYLIAVQLAGSLLLVALVGAVAIASHGSETRALSGASAN